ncbi:hypothetical protein HWV62_31823 [Athelia sp. TMB]|nr:hypothetical protein HWV62_31823 [Athelia sp. TMB]
MGNPNAKVRNVKTKQEVPSVPDKLIGVKRELANDAVVAERSGTISEASPSKSRTKPSNRTTANVVQVPSHAGTEHKQPHPKSNDIVFSDDEGPVLKTANTRKSRGIVFSDDEESVSIPSPPISGLTQYHLSGAVETLQDPVVGVQGDVDGEVASGQEFNDVFVDDIAEEAEEDDTGSACDDTLEEDADNHSAYSQSKAAGKRKMVFSRTPSPVNQTVDRMETESEMYASARKESIKSIASTNPGDGSKRLYGVDTYIPDEKDAQGRYVHQRMPVTPTRPKPNIHRIDFKGDDATVAASASKRTQYSEGEEMKLLSDTEPRGQSSPAVCQVSNKADMDPIISYAGVVNLLGGKHLDSWNRLQGPGLIMPSGWFEQIPGISMARVRGSIEFKGYEHFVNPSRMTPSDMGLHPYPGNSFIVPWGSTRPATFTTSVLITSSSLFRMKEVFGEDRRMISGIPHTTEWQRMESGLLMALHADSAHAQVAQQSITFSTARSMGSGMSFLSAVETAFIDWLTASTSPAKNPSRMFRQPAVSASSAGSPFAGPISTIQGAGHVPVLDGRSIRFNFKDDLMKLDKLLPPFNAEVPEGSCAWIGYSVNKYTTTKGTHINFNLLWVVVLGIPE